MESIIEIVLPETNIFSIQSLNVLKKILLYKYYNVNKLSAFLEYFKIKRTAR